MPNGYYQKTEMNRNFFYRCGRYALLSSMLLMEACTIVAIQPMHQVTLSEVERKLTIPVRLDLSDEFRNAKWERNMGDTRILPLGENLVALSRKMIENVFMTVMGGPGDPNVAVISPKVISIEQAIPVWTSEETKLLIIVEWTLKRPDGRTVWTQTIQGIGSGPTGNAFTDSGRSVVRVQRALNDLFQKSQDEMTTSAILRSLP